MELKKNPRKKLENYSRIFFQIGIVLTLFIIYISVEHKTYEKDYSSGLGELTLVNELEEEIPIVNMKEIKPPPPKTPTIVEAVKVVEDELQVEETIVESTETDEAEAVIAINTDDIEEAEEVEEIVEDIPFMLIQNVPVFPGCKGNNDQLKRCFSKKTQEHFSEKFNVGLATELGLSEGKKKMFVVFRIDQKGNVVDVKSRGPHPALEREVVKIMGKLPQMKPGRQRGKPVPVSYSLPITFQVLQ